MLLVPTPATAGPALTWKHHHCKLVCSRFYNFPIVNIKYIILCYWFYVKPINRFFLPIPRAGIVFGKTQILFQFTSWGKPNHSPLLTEISYSSCGCGKSIFKAPYLLNTIMPEDYESTQLPFSHEVKSNSILPTFSLMYQGLAGITVATGLCVCAHCYVTYIFQEAWANLTQMWVVFVKFLL